MKLTIHNRTTETVYVWPDVVCEKAAIINASSSSTIPQQRWPLFGRTVTLSKHPDSTNIAESTRISSTTLLWRSPTKSWRLVSKAGGLTVYAFNVSGDSSEEMGHHLLLLPLRDLSTFLGSCEDDRSLTSLCLPGTHDTLAFYGWPISQCQFRDDPLIMQLNLGIRVLDIRMAVVDGRLIAYHGIAPQRTPFSQVLAVIFTFFTSHPTETLVMSIKQEDFAKTPPATFSSLVRTEIYAGPGGMEMWFLQNRIPKLGEVRGKVIMLSRFGGDGSGWHGGLEGLGIHPTTWPDSSKEGFSWHCKETLVRTHDWYSIPSFLSIPEKVELATKILFDGAELDVDPLNITYLSAASIPLALPPTVARGFGWPNWGLGVEGVNSRVGRKLLEKLTFNSSKVFAEKPNGPLSKPDITGWVFMDFFTDPESLAPLLVEFNFTSR